MFLSNRMNERINKRMNYVAVLMSTYNGEKYLQEQIDSILSQVNVAVDLYIRDDGSKDQTKEIIKQYQNEHRNVFLIEGENVGVGNSFMELVYQAPSNYDYYAFADQDDVWLPEKLIRAIDMIVNEDEPVLYTSNQTIVDQNLSIIKERYDIQPDVSYMQILSSNQVSGCTMVWNRQLFLLLKEEKRRPSKELLMCRIHDVWVAMVAAVIGKIYYDPCSYIYYRQHSNNVVGVRKASVFQEWKRKLKLPVLRNGRSKLAREIISDFGIDIGERIIKEKLEIFAYYNKDIKKKIILLFDSELPLYSDESSIALRIKILVNLF